MGFKIQKEVKKGIGASRRTEHQDVPWGRIAKPKKKTRRLVTGRRHKVSLRGNPDPH